MTEKERLEAVESMIKNAAKQLEILCDTLDTKTFIRFWLSKLDYKEEQNND